MIGYLQPQANLPFSSLLLLPLPGFLRPNIGNEHEESILAGEEVCKIYNPSLSNVS